MEEEVISPNTIGYIKVDTLFITEVANLHAKYLIIKEALKKEIIKELSEKD